MAGRPNGLDLPCCELWYFSFILHDVYGQSYKSCTITKQSTEILQKLIQTNDLKISFSFFKIKKSFSQTHIMDFYHKTNMFTLFTTFVFREFLILCSRDWRYWTDKCSNMKFFMNSKIFNALLLTRGVTLEINTLPTEEQNSGRGSNWRTDSSFHFDFLYFLMWAAMELVISTLFLFCP